MLIATKCRTATLSVLAIILLSGTAASQTVGDDTTASRRGFWLGVVGGGNIVLYGLDPVLLWPGKTCAGVTGGSGTDGWGGIAMEYFLDSNTRNHYSLVAHVVYDSRSAYFSQWNCGNPSAKSVKNGVVYDSSVEASQLAKLHYWSLDAFIKYNFWAGERPVGLGLMVGPEISYLPHPTLLKTITTVQSSGDVSNPRAVTNDTLTVNAPEANSLVLGVRCALTCDIPFSKSLNAELSAGFDEPLTIVDHYSNWNTRVLFAGVSLRYFIGE